jgi:demethylmenaquinone methyltransferase/2-methoxy-6-polyprenyl-1,4-benzoquinol methylase
VVQVCKEIDPENLLDICSGTGAQCLLLDRAGINTVGLDLSEAMVRSARRRSPPTVSYVHGSAFALPFDDQTFACALLILALHGHTHALWGLPLYFTDDKHTVVK